MDKNQAWSDVYAPQPSSTVESLSIYPWYSTYYHRQIPPSTFFRNNWICLQRLGILCQVTSQNHSIIYRAQVEQNKCFPNECNSQQHTSLTSPWTKQLVILALHHRCIFVCRVCHLLNIHQLPNGWTAPSNPWPQTPRARAVGTLEHQHLQLPSQSHIMLTLLISLIENL